MSEDLGFDGCLDKGNDVAGLQLATGVAYAVTMTTRVPLIGTMVKDWTLAEGSRLG